MEQLFIERNNLIAIRVRTAIECMKKKCEKFLMKFSLQLRKIQQKCLQRLRQVPRFQLPSIRNPITSTNGDWRAKIT